jgi:hypothetical protein
MCAEVPEGVGCACRSDVEPRARVSAAAAHRRLVEGRHVISQVIGERSTVIGGVEVMIEVKAVLEYSVRYRTEAPVPPTCLPNHMSPRFPYLGPWWFPTEVHPADQVGTSVRRSQPTFREPHRHVMVMVISEWPLGFSNGHLPRRLQHFVWPACVPLPAMQLKRIGPRDIWWSLGSRQARQVAQVLSHGTKACVTPKALEGEL